MAPGDSIEFAVCLANMNGIVNLSTLSWRPPVLMDIEENESDALTYNREVKLMQMKGDRRTKVYCNTNRICEVEDAVVEWINVSIID